MQEWIKAQYVIARAYDGELLVIDAPDELKGTLEGYLCEDNYFSNLGIIPAEKGLYLVDCEIYYDDGTCYLGEAADQEWVVRCKKATILTKADTAQGCIYCGHKELKKMEILEPKEGEGMREIKFRGKRLDNGEWVYGSLLMLEPQEKSLEPLHCFIFPLDKGCHRVIPETVGQYTGLKDKNGVEIYECDIIKYHPEANAGIGQVIYIGSGFYVIDEFNGLLDEFAVMGIEVIGNIYENPELLKEMDEA